MSKLSFGSPKVQVVFVTFMVAWIGVALLWHSFASSPVVATLQAEQMVLPTGVTAVSDTNASGGQAVKLTKNGALAGTITLPSAATSITVTARASQCRGWPMLSIAVDGTTVLANSSVSSTSWTGYSATVNLGSGNHNVNLSGSNFLAKGKCSRALYLDVTTFYGPAPVTTPPPTVSFSSTPTSVTAGQLATLTWNSTNSSSCTASGGWSGSEPTAGSTSTGALNTSTTYNLSCTGMGGSASSSVTVTVTPPSSASGNPSGLPWKSGVTGDWKAFASWRGRPVDTVVVYNHERCFNGCGDNMDDTYSLDNNGGNDLYGSGYRGWVVFSQALLPKDDSGTYTLAKCGSGSYNSDFAAIATRLKNDNFAGVYVRLGWEMNGDWYQWGLGRNYGGINNIGHETDFINCWRQAHDAMKAVYPALLFDWNPTKDSSHMGDGQNATATYPGDGYVDVVGVDYYDYYPPYANDTDWNNDYNTTMSGGPRGLGTWLAFAQAHGKPLSFPEWALSNYGSFGTAGGGGDNPYFVTKMFQFLQQHAANIAYESYFDVSNGTNGAYNQTCVFQVYDPSAECQHNGAFINAQAQAAYLQSYHP